MTLLEFWGCALIAFGPVLAMFTLTIANDPIKVILLISSSFFWLISYLIGAVCWTICDYLIIVKKAQFYLNKILEADDVARNKRTSRSSRDIIQPAGSSLFKHRIPMSYVSGLGFGIMSGAFSLINVLTDSMGPGSVGLKGDSQYFLLVSSLTTLAFILLNVSWSVIMSESIEKSDKRLASLVILTHLTATTITFINSLHMQLISLITVYALTILCGLGAFKIAGYSPARLVPQRFSYASNNDQRQSST